MNANPLNLERSCAVLLAQIHLICAGPPPPPLLPPAPGPPDIVGTSPCFLSHVFCFFSSPLFLLSSPTGFVGKVSPIPTLDTRSVQTVIHSTTQQLSTCWIHLDEQLTQNSNGRKEQETRNDFDSYLSNPPNHHQTTTILQNAAHHLPHGPPPAAPGGC